MDRGKGKRHDLSLTASWDPVPEEGTKFLGSEIDWTLGQRRSMGSMASQAVCLSPSMSERQQRTQR